MRRLTDDEVIRVLDRMIEQRRPARSLAEDSDAYMGYAALKTAVEAVRARQPTASTDLAAALQTAIDLAHRGKSGPGFEPGHLRSIAEMTIGKWPVIKHALTRSEGAL
jgi:hypothetical protein